MKIKPGLEDKVGPYNVQPQRPIPPSSLFGVTPWNFANYKLMFNCIYRVIDYTIDLNELRYGLN